MLMIGLILFIAVIGFSLSDRKELTWPEKFLGDSVGFAQQWFYKPAGLVAGFFEDIRELKTLHEENEQLKLTAAAYARDKINYNFVQKENERLQKELHFTERQKNMYKYNYLIAQVIAIDNDPYNHTMVINLGSKNGIKPNMAVTTIDGLVGLVSNVRPYTATVTPLTELDDTSPTSNAIAATVLGRENESFGIVGSYDKETDRLIMTKIAENDKMIVDDTVITSGLGNVYPRGLVIGTVETRQVGDFGLTHTATIKMAAKFDHLTEVFVVQPTESGDE
ncbi:MULTISPECIES: rod shape-determining protein MreC [Paenibacillus]|uniref:Cell shape-determining protein MreC n=1 Tax=Paenibacillus glycanilyticus TaxID=126569 RepID=A0ABQ6NQ65_9BACL|nr:MULTISPECIES: rod shape-determining protein MreC [Paenibacillus]GMK47218.1 cell shape-determining protein MreC [Paenibacillus glycanilyticus]